MTLQYTPNQARPGQARPDHTRPPHATRGHTKQERIRTGNRLAGFCRRWRPMVHRISVTSSARLFCSSPYYVTVPSPVILTDIWGPFADPALLGAAPIAAYIGEGYAITIVKTEIPTAMHVFDGD